METSAFRREALGDGLVVYDHDRVMVLNATASLIWEARAAGLSRAETARRLCVDYGVGRRRALSDVAALEHSWRIPDGAPLEPCAARGPARAGADRGRGARRRAPAVRGLRAGARSYLVFELAVRMRYKGRRIEELVHGPFEHLESAERAATAVEVDVAQEGAEVVARVDGRVLVRHSDPRVVAMHLHYELARAAATSRDRLMILHAAALSRGRQCVVLPAPGGSGKSTLTAALLYSGFGYLGDDLVPLERRSRLAIPVPMSLKLKQGSLPALQGRDPGLSELEVYSCPGLPDTRYLSPPGFADHPPPSACPVACLVFPSYRPGADLRLAPVAPLAALEKILAAGALLGRPIEPTAVAELVRWVEDTPAFELTYADLGEAVAAVNGVLTACSEERPQTEGWWCPSERGRR